MKREDAFNEMLGKALVKAKPKWIKSVIVEETQKIHESKGLRVDVLVAPNDSPVVAIETSYLKGDADRDAIARLGKHYVKDMEEIKTAVAIELDGKYRKIKRLLPNHVLSYALYQKVSETEHRRFPKKKFIKGTYKDIARLVSASSIPKEDIESVANEVNARVRAVSEKLKSVLTKRQLEEISKELYQRSAMPALNTTAILWLDAFLVQRMLQGSVLDIPQITHYPSECVRAWDKLQKINWSSIFRPAVSILENASKMETVKVSESLRHLINSVEMIEASKLGRAINIGAELFPMLASDRKNSAAFYTQAPTAELLAALTITHDMRDDWSDPTLFKNFKIADMACGTGTLLRFGYRQARIYHEQSGSNKVNIETLHKLAMESGLYGLDVSPIAAHLTASSLAVNSRQPYDKTHIGWVRVGDPDRTGSIEYIKADAIPELGFTGPNIESGKDAEHTYNSVHVPDNSMDVCLMNPPYSRTRKGQSAFDIGGMNNTERDKCQSRWGKLIRDEPCTKTAGMAATFLCIARKKVKPGGRIGFVLPRTVAFATSWSVTRKMIEDEFEDITAVVVESSKALGKKAMSVDTKMEEMLLVATKKKEIEKNNEKGSTATIRCVVLQEPIARVGEAAEVAKTILNGEVEGALTMGTQIGVSILFSAKNGMPWSSLSVTNDGLDMVMNSILKGKIKNIEGTVATKVAMTTVGELFNVGPTHHLVGHVHDDDNDSKYHKIGAFTLHPLMGGRPTQGMYRSLWQADMDSQTKMEVLPTHRGVKFNGEKAGQMWDTRTHLFLSRGMTWPSQKITSAFTKQRVMGGSAWLGLDHENVAVMKAFALWANSIYGMTAILSQGGKTQHGSRSRLQVKAAKNLPCPDFASFDGNVLAQAAADFDRLSKETLKPSNQAETDKARAEINKAVSVMLGIPKYDTETLTEMWCAEPAVGAIVKPKKDEKPKSEGLEKTKNPPKGKIAKSKRQPKKEQKKPRKMRGRRA